VGDDIAQIEKVLASNFAVTEKSFAEPELAAARASAVPQQMYANLTARCPVRDLGDGMYTLLTLDDILYVTKHHDVEQGSKYLGSDRPAIPLGLDGAEHRKYRRLLDPVFAAKQVAPLASSIRQLAGEMIDDFIDTGGTDVYSAWCEPLPSQIFLSIMGLPLADLDDFLRFKRLTLGNEAVEGQSLETKLANAAEAVTWIHDYFNRELDRRDAAPPQDDMLGWLLVAEVDGHRLDRQEMLDILGLLMIAGLDTVAASLACFLSYFARVPAHRARVVEAPALLRSAIEELMRFESPVTEGVRLAKTDLVLPSGTKIPAGASMLVSWSSANLDAKTFPNPLQVDLERSPNPHIGFASGYHRCLGAHLARLEMEVALAVWHERIPNYQIKPGETLVYSGNPRAPHHLRLVW
jgi:cytochrome P450